MFAFPAFALSRVKVPLFLAHGTRGALGAFPAGPRIVLSMTLTCDTKSNGQVPAIIGSDICLFARLLAVFLPGTRVKCGVGAFEAVPAFLHDEALQGRMLIAYG